MHAHGGSERTKRVLRVSLLVTAAYIVLLVIAGIRSHSLALLSEAGHNFTDLVALSLSLSPSICTRGHPTQPIPMDIIVPEFWPHWRMRRPW